LKVLIAKEDDPSLDVVMVMCDCYEPTHSLLIMRDKIDAESFNLFYISMRWGDEATLWGRICWAFRYIFSGPWHDEVVLDRASITKLGETLAKLGTEPSLDETVTKFLTQKE